MAIEIEAENKSDLENLFKFFEVSECFSESTPEIMRKLQNIQIKVWRCTVSCDVYCGEIRNKDKSY